jgi:hypothetical protein
MNPQRDPNGGTPVSSVPSFDFVRLNWRSYNNLRDASDKDSETSRVLIWTVSSSNSLKIRYNAKTPENDPKFDLAYHPKLAHNWSNCVPLVRFSPRVLVCVSEEKVLLAQCWIMKSRA